MKKMVSLMAALLGALFFAVPAFAQTDEAHQGEMVTLTFRLTVEGEVPGWQNFVVEYYPAGGQPGRAPLCSTDADQGPAGPWCLGGNSYTASVKVPAGNPVTFRFLRHDTRTAPEYFKEETEAYAADHTVEASYDFPGGAPKPIPAVEPDDAGEAAAQNQYANDGTIPKAHTTAPGSGVPDATATSVPASVEAEPQSVTPTASVSASASQSASASASASADTTSPTIEVLPDTGGIGALPILALVLMLLGAGSALRKVL